MARIFLTRRIPEEGLAMLREHEMDIYEGDAPPTKEEIIEGVRGKDVLICLLTDPIDAEVIDASPRLKIIANYAVGIDNIDVKAATERGISVTNTPGVLTETVADLTWALLMSVARRIVESDAFMRDGKFKGWAPLLMLGSDVHRKTLGIIGAGRIGRAVAARARGFDMKVLYYSRSRNEEIERSCNARFVNLQTLLEESDYVSLHTPFNEHTYHLIGEKELRLMKPSAYLINTARGKCIDERALARALKEGWIRGAALDVFEHEPAVTPELMELDNVVLAPHIGSASYETRSKMAVMVAENVRAVLQGVMPPNCVNPDVWKK